ncbi:MAG: phosphoribosyltransferase family protein [Clostridiales Family XIII bacterium]|jgi:adenine/guanine phosphoribosyltransferase-like PRPP-binding protein|nr:phosphoribosyltransferase family protein [Clostridiales Family XIII bacterium]
MIEYTEANIIKIAKRFNNSKRGYLLVNRLQAKHIPVCPRQALDMMESLAVKVARRLRSASLPTGDSLVIGFAETATAIGAAVALELGGAYIHTTREPLQQAGSPITFLEEHSHAAEHSLYPSKLSALFRNASNILLVDDEISTGKTVLNMLSALRKRFPEAVSKNILAVSVVNRMRVADAARFTQLGIGTECLFRMEHRDYSQTVCFADSPIFIDCRGGSAVILAGAAGRGQHSAGTSADAAGRGQHSADTSAGAANRGQHSAGTSADAANREQRSAGASADAAVPCTVQRLHGRRDPRAGILAGEYADACQAFAIQAATAASPILRGAKRILVLGAEEFMYPAILAGKLIKERFSGAEVACHATTRSPIAVSRREGYPIDSGYMLRSFYSASRLTYIYNLRHCDAAILLTDSGSDVSGACSDLSAALGVHGCGSLCCFVWCE